MTGELLAGPGNAIACRALVRQAAEACAISFDAAASDVHMLASRDPRFLALEPAAAVDAQLRALVLLTPVTHASLWLPEDGREQCLGHAGAKRSQRLLRQAVQSALNGKPNGNARGSILRGLPVTRWGTAYGALVVQPHPRRIRRAVASAREAALALAPILERQLLLEHSTHSGEQLIEAADRRIARLGYDIHDGPLQDTSILLGELAAIGRQLVALVPDEASREQAERRVADLQTVVVDLNRELRELALSAGGYGAVLSLREGVEREVTRFARRTHIHADLDIESEPKSTTPSQRIAIARVVEEALANVREHAHAAEVHVSVGHGAGFLYLKVVDDGRGFDVGRALRRAGRDHHLGLVTMAERMRLLGGGLEIDSRPGGPTIVSAVLPAWEPTRALSSHAATANDRVGSLTT